MNIIVFGPLLGLFAGVLGVIVLLEDDVRGVLATLINGLHQLIAQNGRVKLPICQQQCVD